MGESHSFGIRTDGSGGIRVLACSPSLNGLNKLLSENYNLPATIVQDVQGYQELERKIKDAHEVRPVALSGIRETLASAFGKDALQDLSITPEESEREALRGEEGVRKLKDLGEKAYTLSNPNLKQPITLRVRECAYMRNYVPDPVSEVVRPGGAHEEW